MIVNCDFQLPNDTSTKLPVWFFLYPGRHIFGDAHTAHYGPHYIMDQPVIFVTAAYRLGPFGKNGSLMGQELCSKDETEIYFR